MVDLGYKRDGFPYVSVFEAGHSLNDYPRDWFAFFNDRDFRKMSEFLKNGNGKVVTFGKVRFGGMIDKFIQIQPLGESWFIRIPALYFIDHFKD